MLENLYTITEFSHENHHINVEFSLNPDHDMFKGHFPGQPVLPGVCQMTLIRLFLEKALNLPLALKNADQIKFLSMIDPSLVHNLMSEITYKQENDEVLIQASITNPEAVFLKYKAIFVNAN
jgi:3-hydroxyacyl-[acyl-carrier-protein] dehydratase